MKLPFPQSLAAQFAVVVSCLVALPVHAWGLWRAGVHIPALLRGFAAPLLATAVVVAALLGTALVLRHSLLYLVTGLLITGAAVAVGWFAGRDRLSAALDARSDS